MSLIIPEDEWRRWCEVHKERHVDWRFSRTVAGYWEYREALEEGAPQAEQLHAQYTVTFLRLKGVL